MDKISKALSVLLARPPIGQRIQDREYQYSEGDMYTAYMPPFSAKTMKKGQWEDNK